MMRISIVAITLLAAVSVVAWAALPILTPTTTSNWTEEAEIRDLVEDFGEHLQAVALLAPNAAQAIETEYAEFVSPALLETWIRNVSEAPGRVVSSPWPDHIEIATLTAGDSGKYMITGFVVEVTSVEAVGGGAAVKVPVRLVVQENEGRWMITEYAETQDQSRPLR